LNVPASGSADDDILYSHGKGLIRSIKVSSGANQTLWEISDYLAAFASSFYHRNNK